jgi:hypothetical protein
MRNPAAATVEAPVGAGRYGPESQPSTSATPPELTTMHTGLLGSVQSVEQQLRRLESRLLAEAGGDAVIEQDVLRHMALARARFASATVQQFLPILIEREVRRRLAG